MAKAEKTKLETAKEELRKAEQAYEELVHRDMSQLNEEQKQQHIQLCRDALNSKREAQRIVEDLKLGRET